MSSGRGAFSVGGGRAGRWSAWRLLASPARSRCGAGVAELCGDGVAVGDDRAGLVFVDRTAVDVAQLVGRLGFPAGGDAGEQGGGDVAERGGVVFAGVDHEPVVGGGEGGVEPSGLVGADEQGLAQQRVAAFGGSSVAPGDAGGVEGGHQSAEGADGGQGVEPGGVAEATEDDRAGDGADAGGGGEDAVRVAVADQHRDALVDFLDLVGEGQREAGLDGDVVGQLGEGQVVVPQLQAGRRRGQELVGHRLAERAAGVPGEEAGEPGPAEPTDGVRVGVAGGEQLQRGVVSQVGGEGGVPGRAEDLQQRVEAGQGRGAPLDQRGVQLGGPAQRVTRAQPAFGV